MADEKLLGTQRLELRALKEDVSKANALLKSLGSGLEIDFSSKITSQLKTQLSEIVKATQDAANTTKSLSSQMSSSAAGVASNVGKQAQTDAQNITRLTSLYKQYYSIRAKLQATDPTSKKASVLSAQSNDIQKEIQAIESLNSKYAQHKKVLDAVTEGKRKLEVAKATAKDKEEAAQLKKTTEAVKQAEDAYKNLRDAYSNYDRATKRGDTESADHWRAEITAQQSILAMIEKQSVALGLNESQRKRLNTLIQKGKDLESEHDQNLKKSSETIQEMTDRMLRFVGTMVLLQGLRTLWQEATEYAQTYYDKLNEIRIVTGASESESLQLGENYRKMAKEMKVSSVDIVSAATEFWRQGLSQQDVDARQVATIQYAKISGLAFEEAAELVTAATNSMDLDVQRVVDVFNYLGDASASGADEIGIAMQKASASAQYAGVSFEWLGAYIATISEQTRQAPEVIGTSMNSIMARLHSIKQKGFNEEDETKINDVAKALNKVGIALMDQDGNWRDLSTIFIELSSVWDTLDDKTQSYLATTMAGTRQQNYFLTLMSDMAKGAEGGSRAFELYEGAINSAGTTTQKYAIWMESVQAAQNGLTAEMEEFYSLLSADWMKGFYNSMAGIVSAINSGTDGMQGFNLVIPLVAAGILGLTAKVTALAAASTAAGGGMAGLWAVIQAHPVALAVTAFAVQAGLLTGISAATQNASVDIGKAMDDMNADISEQNTVQTTFTNNGREIEAQKQRYVELAGKASLTATEQAELQSIMSQIVSMSPGLAEAVRNTSGAFGAQAEIVRGLNAELAENYAQGLLASQKAAREGFASSATAANAQQVQKDKLDVRAAGVKDYEDFRDKNYTRVGNIYGTYDKNGVFSEVDDRTIFSAYVNSRTAKRTGLEQGYTGGMNELAQKNAEFYKMWGFDGSVVDFNTQYSSYADYKYDVAAWDEQSQALRLGIESQLNAFQDTKGLSSAILADASSQANELLNSLDYANVTENDLLLASQKMEGIFVDAQKRQEQLNSNAEASQLQKDIDQAKAVFEADKTEENLNAYNALVKKWNENYSDQATVEELSADTIKKAEAATETTEQSVGAAEAYAKTKVNQIAQQEAAEKGYIDQLNQAKAELGEGGQGFQAYRDYMDNLAETNLGLYTALMDQYPELAKIYSGDERHVGEDAIAAIDNAIAQSDAVAKKNQEYYSSVKKSAESTSVPTADVPEIQDYIQTLLSTLQSGYAEGGAQFGLDSLIAQIGTLGEEAEASLLKVAPWLPKLMDGTMSYAEVLTELNTLMEGTAENWAAYFEQLTGGTSTGTEEALGFLDRLTNMEGSTESIEAFRTAWNGLTEDAREAVYELIGTDMKEYLDEVVEGGEESEAAFEKLRKEAKKLRRENTAKYFKDTVKATYDLEDGTKSVEEAYADFRKEAEQATEANKEYSEASEKVAEGAEIAAEDIQTLSDYLGMAPETIIKNWDVAGRLLASSLAEGEAALHALNEAAFINITGTSSADFSELSNGLIMVTAQAQDVIDALRATGQWELQTIELPQTAKYWIPNATGTGGSWGTVTATAGASVLKYTGSASGINTGGSTASSKSSGGGGGGGGGGNKTNATADEQQLVDSMEHAIDVIAKKLEALDSIMSKYETEGYLTGIINGLEMENELLEEQTKLYEENLAVIDEKLAALYKELATKQVGTAAYDEILSQIEILEETYNDYTLAILDNEAALAENTKAIKEHRDEIRQMEIDLRDELLSAIEDRIEREEEALDARIEMEDQILDAIIRRHEEERDQILETTALQIDALEREKDALDEALEARKKAAEDENRQLELEELESQYARIIADPTRAKEALEIQKEIIELRDEIAWDKAEEEVEAQKESLDQQITSLEDYEEYIEKYYADLLENPRNFLAEVNEILSQSHEDIIAWLEQYNEDYANSTDSARAELENGWTETLNTMNGIITTHWEEIESIIQQGDEAIIEFLKENSQDYKEAGELQAQAYVDAWMEQLEALHKAYVDLQPDLPEFKETDTTTTSNSGSNSGGSSGSNGSSSSKKWYIVDSSGNKIGQAYTTEADAKSKLSQEITYWNNSYRGALNSHQYDLARDYQNNYTKWSSYSVKKFARGGLVDFTGPAWLDGSTTSPERVLSPYQTKQFETMVEALQKVATVNIPSLPLISAPERGRDGSLSFGDIVINVDKLESDADYEEIAKKVGEVLLRQMNKGSYVGGMRYSF